VRYAADPVDLSCQGGLSDRSCAEAKGLIADHVIEAEDEAAAERTVPETRCDVPLSLD
jgi:hypothetical protein